MVVEDIIKKKFCMARHRSDIYTEGRRVGLESNGVMGVMILDAGLPNIMDSRDRVCDAMYCLPRNEQQRNAKCLVPLAKWSGLSNPLV